MDGKKGKKNIFIILISIIVLVIIIVGISVMFYNNSKWENKFDLSNVKMDANWIRFYIGLNVDTSKNDLRFDAGYLRGTIKNKTNNRYEVTIYADFYDDMIENKKTGSGSDTITISYNDERQFSIEFPKYTSNYKITKIKYKKV